MLDVNSSKKVDAGSYARVASDKITNIENSSKKLSNQQYA